MKIDDILNMSLKEFNRLTEKEISKVLNYMNKVANERARRLLKNKMLNTPAFKTLKNIFGLDNKVQNVKMRDVSFTNPKDSTLNEKRNLFMRVKSFLQAKTSTVTGAQQWKKEQAERFKEFLKGNKKVKSTTEEPVSDTKEPEEPVSDTKESEEPVSDTKEPEEPEEPVSDTKEPEEPVSDTKESEEPVSDTKEPEEPEEPVSDTKESEEPISDDIEIDEDNMETYYDVMARIEELHPSMPLEVKYEVERYAGYLIFEKHIYDVETIIKELNDLINDLMNSYESDYVKKHSDPFYSV